MLCFVSFRFILLHHFMLIDERLDVGWLSLLTRKEKTDILLQMFAYEVEKVSYIYLKKYFKTRCKWLPNSCMHGLILFIFFLLKPQLEKFTCCVSEKQMFVWLEHRQIWRSPACWHLIELFASRAPLPSNILMSVAPISVQFSGPEKTNGSLWWDKGDREGRYINKSIQW